MAEFSASRIGKYGSRERQICNLLLQGKSREDVMRELAPLIGKKDAFTYYENTSGRRGRPSYVDSTPKPLEDQFRLFQWTVQKTIKEMEEQGWDNPEPYAEKRKWSSKERTWVQFRKRHARELMRATEREEPEPPESNSGGTFIPEGPHPEEYPEAEPEFIPPTLPEDVYDERGNLITEYQLSPDGREIERIDHEPPPIKRRDDIDFYYQVMMRAREFVITREIGGEFLDFVSTRAITDGAKAIAHGVRVDEVITAVTKTWPEDSKELFAQHTREWRQPERLINPEYYPDERALPNSHQYLGYVLRLSDARIPIFLVGPSGCGKSFLAKDLSEALEMPYGELPLTAGATPSWLAGAETISGYKSRPFVDIYGSGGVFCFEEMDAADPNMLLLVNNALANEAFTNPVTGKEIPKHADFIPVATANTWGLGANRQYVGRERLDAATLDRWRIGRVEMDYDAGIEKAIVDFWKNEADKLEGYANGHKPTKARKVKKAVRT